MGIQRSMSEDLRRNQAGGKGRTHGEGALHLAAAAKYFLRVAARGLERLKTSRSRSDKGRQMKLIESLALGNRRQLLLVVCENQTYLVGAGAESVGSILAVEGGAVSRDRAVRGPELVRRREPEASLEVRTKPSDPRLDQWN